MSGVTGPEYNEIFEIEIPVGTTQLTVTATSNVDILVDFQSDPASSQSICFCWNCGTNCNFDATNNILTITAGFTEATKYDAFFFFFFA